MKCDRCEAEMFQAKMEAAPVGEVYLMNKKKGIFESEKRSRILCYVCPECGHMEFAAESPKSLKID